MYCASHIRDKLQFLPLGLRLFILFIIIIILLLSVIAFGYASGLIWVVYIYRKSTVSDINNNAELIILTTVTGIVMDIIAVTVGFLGIIFFVGIIKWIFDMFIYSVMFCDPNNNTNNIITNTTITNNINNNSKMYYYESISKTTELTLIDNELDILGK